MFSVWHLKSIRGINRIDNFQHKRKKKEFQARSYKLILKSIDVKSEWSSQRRSRDAAVPGAAEDSGHSGLCTPASFCASSCLLCPLVTLVSGFIQMWLLTSWTGESQEAELRWRKVTGLLWEVSCYSLKHTHTCTQTGHRISSAESSHQTRGFGANMVRNDPRGLRISGSVPNPTFLSYSKRCSSCRWLGKYFLK